MTPARPQIGLTALVPAAGSGERYGGPRPKQFQEIAGRPLLTWTLGRLRAAGVERFVVAVPPSLVHVAEAELGPIPGLRFIAGATTRQSSVEACLLADNGRLEDLVLVHDGARPLVDPADIRSTVEAAAKSDGAILGRIVKMVLGKGYEVLNCDLTLLAEAPRIGPYREAIRERIAGILAVEVGAVGLKATTHEGLGPIGRGEGMAALAVVLLRGEVAS